MSKYQQELKKVMQRDIKRKWKVRTSGSDILIRVPEDTDMQQLEQEFPGLIAQLSPNPAIAKSNLTFYVGNTEQADLK